MRAFIGISLLLLLTITTVGAQAPRASVTGELKRWHKVVVTLDGPPASATATPNPFLDLRMDVVFTHAASGTTFRVPGYFDADGDAANTSAQSGRTWRAVLRPNKTGGWSYRISFRQGKAVAVSDSPDTALTPYDGVGGSFTIAETDKTGRDFRAKGMLKYVGKHHLQYEGSGEYFLKVGADSPENLLAYDEFDDTPNYKWEGRGSATGGGFRHSFRPHVSDWKAGDATWKNGKGKGLIGAMNYMASKGLNSQSFLTYNTHGDDRNVSPYIDDEDRTRLSIPKVNQWGIVFDHMEKLGLYMEFKLMEMENHWDHDAGELGPERKLYYRELIARFGHHLGVKWNIGEESTSTRAQRLAFADYIHATDPYKHLIVVHTVPGNWERTYLPLLEPESKYRGASLQINFYDVFDVTRYLRMMSAARGTPWVITIDESRPAPAWRTPKLIDGAAAPDAVDPDHDEGRKGSLWANIMAGGAGMNTYLGFGSDVAELYTSGTNASAPAKPARISIPDLMLENFRDFDGWWDQMRIAHAFFVDNKLPFQEMSNRNELVSTGWALADAETIVAYFPGGAVGSHYPGNDITSPFANTYAPPLARSIDGAVFARKGPRQAPGREGGVEAVGPGAGGNRHGKGPTAGPGTPTVSPTVHLNRYKGSYEVSWYDPRRGGALRSGSIARVTGGGKDPVEIGHPPVDPEKDWAVLLRPMQK